jgi:hypothetical protein
MVMTYIDPTSEEVSTLADELAYWMDDAIEVRLDSEYARISKVYEDLTLEETEWQNVH